MTLLLLGVFVTTLLLIYLLILWAERLNLTDIPNQRSMHTTIIPRGAGIAFVFSVVVMLLLFDFAYLQAYSYVYGAIVIVFVAGVWDDMRDITPKVKLLFIFVATLLLYSQGFALETLGNYFGYELLLPSWFTFPFTFFAIAGFTNALNLMDGLDGLASLVAIVIMVAFLALGIEYEDRLLTTLPALFIVTLVAFLYFNWHPAKIFMGDSGSLSLGVVISILAIQATEYVAPVSVLFLIALPLLDTFIVITRRLQRHKSPLEADKNHMHHFFYNLKQDTRYTVMIFALMQTVFSIIGYQLRDANEPLSLVLFGILFYLYLTLFDQRRRHRHRS